MPIAEDSPNHGEHEESDVQERQEDGVGPHGRRERRAAGEGPGEAEAKDQGEGVRELNTE